MAVAQAWGTARARAAVPTTGILEGCSLCRAMAVTTGMTVTRVTTVTRGTVDTEAMAR